MDPDTERRHAVDPDTERRIRTASLLEEEETIGAPWRLVVARGHARLVAEIQAIFRENPRVIENRRRGHALLPRNEGVLRPAS